MSGSITLENGQVFTGNASLGAGDTGVIALTKTGSVTFNTSSTPVTISSVEIKKDSLGSAGFTVDIPFEGPTNVTIDSVTIGAVTHGAVVTLTTADLPAGTTVPSGFHLPETVTGVTFGVTLETSQGEFTGTAALFGTDGSLALVALQSLDVDGFNIDAGAAVLSLGTQTTGDGLAEVFTPAFTQPCFRAGTGIATPEGERAVETLVAGDLVLTRSGEARPVAWVGHRRVDCRRHPNPEKVWPVRVRAGAFGPGLPRRDLFLSPDHAVLFEGALIPVRCLTNGASIAQQAADTVGYWHVELERHDVLLADGLPCESFLDTGNRGAFANGGATMEMHADFAPRVWDGDACAPLVLDGPALAAARRHLLARAAALAKNADAA